jgi:MOB kinase activator 1
MALASTNSLPLMRIRGREREGRIAVNSGLGLLVPLLRSGAHPPLPPPPAHEQTQSQATSLAAFDFFNHINTFYGILSESCTAEYAWTDSKNRVQRMHAPQYADCAMSWIQNVVADEGVFPTKADLDFPKDFLATLRLVYKHLFRVLAHMYHAHYSTILNLGCEAHVNTLTAHFLCFAREFDLLPDKKEAAALADAAAEWEAAGLM